MLDAATGRLLGSTALRPNNPTGGAASHILADDRTNRVFSTSEANNRLSVLDATTGKLLYTVAFPNAKPDPEAVEPLGVDSRDSGVLVHAPDGLVLVDERTGAAL